MDKKNAPNRENNNWGYMFLYFANWYVNYLEFNFFFLGSFLCLNQFSFIASELHILAEYESRFGFSTLPLCLSNRLITNELNFICQLTMIRQVNWDCNLLGLSLSLSLCPLYFRHKCSVGDTIDDYLKLDCSDSKARSVCDVVTSLAYHVTRTHVLALFIIIYNSSIRAGLHDTCIGIEWRHRICF